MKDVEEANAAFYRAFEALDLRAMDEVWFVASEETTRIDRLVARHIQFGKSPDEARAWVAATDQRNARLVEGTAGRAERVIINDEAGWGLGQRQPSNTARWSRGRRRS